MTNERPLENRGKLTTVKYFCKIRSHLGNPAFRYVVPNYCRKTFQAKRLFLPFCIWTRKLFKEMNVINLYIKAAFSYQIRGMVTPSWKINLPEVNLLILIKATTSDSIYKQMLASILEEHNADNQMYTDGSKSDGGVGASVVFDERIIASFLPHCTSILSAELYALSIAVNNTKRINKNSIILTDSYSPLMALLDMNKEHPTVKYIQYDCYGITEYNKRAVFCWIPSPMGLLGNEMADQAARSASMRPPEYIPVFYRLVSSAVRQNK